MSMAFGLGASFSGDHFRGTILAQGGGHEFYRRAPAPHYGWGRGWGDRPHGWGGSRVGIGLNVVINDIGAFFRNLFHRNTPAANEPVFCPPYQAVAANEGMFCQQDESSRPDPRAWQPYYATRPSANLPTYADQHVTGVDLTRNPELRLSANDVCLGNSVSGYRDERSWEQRIYGRNIGNG